MAIPAEPTLEPAAEPQSVSEVQGTLSRVAREAAAVVEPPAPSEPEAPADPDTVFNDLADLGDDPADPTLEEPVEVPEVPADLFAELGADRPTVEAALRLHQATQTEDGIIQLFLEAGKQLGVGLDKIEALFTGAAPAPAAGEPEYDYDTDPDRPLTVREFQEQQRQQAEAARQAQQQAQITQARQAAATAVQSAVKDLGMSMEDDAAQLVLTLGNKYLPQGGGTPTPEQAADAVRRGHADYLAQIERDRQKYIAEKRKVADTVPKAPAGSAAPSEPAPAEPKDSLEAIKLARQRFKAAGILS